MNAFQPSSVSGAVKLSVTTSSQIEVLPGSDDIRFDISGNGAVHITWGSSAVTAGVATGQFSVRLPSGAIEILRPPHGATHFAYIGAAASELIYTPGTGI